MTTYYLRSGSGSPGSGTFRGTWAVATTYASGDRVTATRAATAARQFRIYECTTGGTSHASTQPTWDSTPGNTTTDNTVTWTCRAATTWANAHMYLDMLSRNDAAGDIIYVSKDHSETSAAALSSDWAGNASSPTRIICVDDTGNPEPPTATATTAVIANTGANDHILVATGANVYFYGITFRCTDGTNNAQLALNNASSIIEYESCVFELVGTNASATISISANSGATTVTKNCQYKFAATGQSFYLTSATWISYNDAIAAGSSAITTLIGTLSAGSLIKLTGFDFSNAAAALNIAGSTLDRVSCLIRNCRMPASWSGSVSSSTPGEGSIWSLQNCDDADTNYVLEHKTQWGTVTPETTIVRTAGASDGTTSISWKMVTGSDAEWSHCALESPEIVKWNTTTGSSVTVTVEFLIDSATTLNNNHVWMEVQYLGTSGVPLSSADTDSKCATYLTTAVECTTGTGTGNWSGEGGTAKSYKCVSTFTPQEVGFIHAVVKLAKASTTIYVDPVLTLS